MANVSRGRAKAAPSPAPAQSADVAELRDNMTRLTREMGNLCQVVSQVAQATTVENVLCHGLEEISVQLAPLRDLTARRKPLEPDQLERLTLLRIALRPPSWGGATTLGRRDDAVHFIGETVPPRAPEPVCGGEQGYTQARRAAP